MVKKIFFIAGFIFFFAAIPVVWYFADVPDTAKLRTENPKTSAIRIFREQQVQKKGKKPRSLMAWRDLDQISPYLRQAVVLTEDDTFFAHRGFDVEQLKRAIKINWERRRFAFGASTLTQQLARTLYLSPRKNLLRKAKEALITRRLEKTLSKNRILELYLNVVEWGPQVYGAEAAAHYFFNKPASELTVDEAISLAVILPNPRRFNPLSEKGFIAGRKIVLYNRMVRAGYIPKEWPAEPLLMDEPLLLPHLNEPALELEKESSTTEEESLTEERDERQPL